MNHVNKSQLIVRNDNKNKNAKDGEKIYALFINLFII